MYKFIKLSSICFLTYFILYSMPTYASPRVIGILDINSGDTYKFDWPNSQMEFRFKGKKFSVDLYSQSNNSMMVTIDGIARRVDLMSGKKLYAFVDEMESKEHSITLTKITEKDVGFITLSAAKTDGVFLPVLEKSRKILVIGDSISTGYGIEGEDVACHFSPQTQNSWLTYAARASRDLNADLLLLASSGRGLVRNFDGSTKGTVPAIINYLIHPKAENAEKDNFIPDVIIIHLGTNDFGNKKLQPPAIFNDSYIKFVSEINRKYPAAFIYLAIGPMLSDEDYEIAKNSIEKVAIFFHKENYKIPVKLIEFRGAPYNQFACDWHPNFKSHEKMASTLTDIISHDMNWNISQSPIFFSNK